MIFPWRASLKSSDLWRHTNPLLCGMQRHLPYTRMSATVARFPRKNLLTISCFSSSRNLSKPMMPNAEVFRTMYPSTTLPHFLHLNFLGIVFPADTILVELEIVTLSIAAESDGIRTFQLVFYP